MLTKDLINTKRNVQKQLKTAETLMTIAPDDETKENIIHLRTECEKINNELTARAKKISNPTYLSAFIQVYVKDTKQEAAAAMANYTLRYFKQMLATAINQTDGNGE